MSLQKLIVQMSKEDSRIFAERVKVLVAEGTETEKLSLSFP